MFQRPAGEGWCLLPTLLGVLVIFLIASRVGGETDGQNYSRVFPHINRNLPNFSFRSGEVRQITPTKNISSLLDNLLKGYDHKLRPSFGGEPTTVEIDIEVRSMGQISEMDMSYSMDCYFRQSWVDERLAFSHLDEAFTLSLAVLDKLWKPDTYIYNGKQSYVHLITTPNKFIRLYRNGRVLYSSRLTINANCPMKLHNFPMDTQRCPLKLGSFAYTTRDVVYRWNQQRQIVIAPDLMLSQFDLIATPSGFENTTRRAGEFSTLLASFYLKRHMGNFLIQVYGPCMLLVVLSWVSFWLNREATSDRISLGITTVLTMTFLGLEARTDLPKVSYSTALDIFVWLSYSFIFATIIEFAFVHIFTKVGSGEIYLAEACSEVESEDEEEEEPETEVRMEIEQSRMVIRRDSVYGDIQNSNHCDNSILIEGNQTACHPITRITEKMKKESITAGVTSQQPVLACTVMALTAPGPNGVDTRLTKTHAVPHTPSTPPWTPALPPANTPIIASPPSNSKVPTRTKRPSRSSSTPSWHTVYSRLTRLCGRVRRRSTHDPPLNAFIKTVDHGGGQKQQQQQPRLARQEQRMRRPTSGVEQMNSVSNIDEVSRVLFPVSFLCINLVYWYIYLSHPR